MGFYIYLLPFCFSPPPLHVPLPLPYILAYTTPLGHHGPRAPIPGTPGSPANYQPAWVTRLSASDYLGFCGARNVLRASRDDVGHLCRVLLLVHYASFVAARMDGANGLVSDANGLRAEQVGEVVGELARGSSER